MTFSPTGSSGSHEKETATILLVPSTVMLPFNSSNSSGTYSANEPSLSSLSSPMAPILTSTFTTVKLVEQNTDESIPASFTDAARRSLPTDSLAVSKSLFRYWTEVWFVGPTNSQMPQAVHRTFVVPENTGETATFASFTVRDFLPSSVLLSPRYGSRDIDSS